MRQAAYEHRDADQDAAAREQAEVLSEMQESAQGMGAMKRPHRRRRD